MNPTIEAALATAVGQVRTDAVAFAERYPADTTLGGTYPPRPAGHGEPVGGNQGWTTGFVPGMAWLAWRVTGEDLFREVGLTHLASFTDRLDRRVDVGHHDLGFLYTLSAVMPWWLLGEEAGRATGLAAARTLMERYLPGVGIFQAWGGLDDPVHAGQAIIDSLLNMPLIHWAGTELGDPAYREAAHHHARNLRDRILRPDGSTFHTFRWDPVTGEPVGGRTAQGFSDESCWARGQAWGIYGFALNHRATGDESLLQAAMTCADHFLERLPADHVPYWDLVFTSGDEERDTSAAGPAVCGLLEIARSLPPGDPQAAAYARAAEEILTSLAVSYTPTEAAGSAPLLLQGVYNKPSGLGVKEGNLWGDYFYLEALVRATHPGWTGFW